MELTTDFSMLDHSDSTSNLDTPIWITTSISENSYDEAENFELRNLFTSFLLYKLSPYRPSEYKPYARYTDKTKDLDFVNFAPVIYNLKAHTLIDLAASYDISETLRLFMRVENVTDEIYTRAYATMHLDAHFTVESA